MHLEKILPEANCLTAEECVKPFLEGVKVIKTLVSETSSPKGKDRSPESQHVIIKTKF